MQSVDLCLPVLKYSYADTESTTSPINWSHFSAVNLCALLQGDNTGHGKLSLSIVDKTTSKETVDVARYVDWANNARSFARGKGTSIQTEQLPIFGITKEALLALRYRLPDGRARRIQLRFENEAQCLQVVQILQRRGLDFQTQRPRTGRPETTLSRLDTPTTEARPRTTQQSLVEPFHDQVARFQRPSMGLNSLAQPQTSTSSPLPAPQDQFRRVDHGSQDQSGAHSHLSQRLPNNLLPGPQQQSAALQTGMRLSTMSSLPAPRAAINGNTTSAPENNDSIAMATHSDSEAHRLAAERAYAAGTFSSNMTAPPLTASSSGSQPSANRPGTADNRTTSASSHSRPSSALELPPLQMPKVLKAKAASALQYSIPAPASSRLTTEPQSSVSQMPHPQLASTVSTGKDQHTGPSLSPLEQLIVGGQTVAQRQISKSLQRASSLLDAPHEIEEILETNTSAVALQSQNQGSRRLDNGQAILNNNSASRSNVPATDEEGSVQTYAAQRPQVRDAALNKFMMDHLQDPAFTVLCADVESCWRRIALGL